MYTLFTIITVFMAATIAANAVEPSQAARITKLEERVQDLEIEVALMKTTPQKSLMPRFEVDE
jgi:hypothetical protein